MKRAAVIIALCLSLTGCGKHFNRCKAHEALCAGMAAAGATVWLLEKAQEIADENGNDSRKTEEE